MNSSLQNEAQLEIVRHFQSKSHLLASYEYFAWAWDLNIFGLPANYNSRFSSNEKMDLT